MITEWLDTDLCCLRVGFDQLNEPEFLAVLGDLLKRRNHINSGYFISTVGKHGDEKTIMNYVKNQGRDPKGYEQIYENK